MSPRSVVAALLALVLAIVGAWLYAAQAHLALINDGLVVAFPLTKCAGAVLIVLGALTLACLIKKRRGLAAITVIVALWFAGRAIYAYRFQLTCDQQGLRCQGLGPSLFIAWSEIRDLRSEAGSLLIETHPGTRRRLSLTMLLPEQRPVIERSIARRVTQTVATPTR